MADDYVGPYTVGDQYAMITRKQASKAPSDLVCPYCNKKCKSVSGYTLHVERWCASNTGCGDQGREAHQSKDVWQLDLESFHEDLKLIDPKAYFITSGEAVIKATRLCEDYERACQAAKELCDVLKSARGSAKYLETQWDMNRLLLKKKNPRPSSRNSMRKLKDG